MSKQLQTNNLGYFQTLDFDSDQDTILGSYFAISDTNGVALKSQVVPSSLNLVSR